jgi:phage gp29-like protein
MDRKKIEEKLLSEIGGVDTDPLNLFNMGLILENPDIILNKLPYYDRIIAFANILSDPHVLSEVRAIRSGILSWEWQIKETEGNSKQFDFLNRVFKSKSVDISTAIWNIASAVFYGGALNEIVYDRYESLFIPVAINDVSVRRLVFNSNNEPRILTKDELTYGIPLPNNKFILTRYMSTYDNPYGESVLSRCYWPWRFKHTTVRCMAKLIERSGVPWVTTKYTTGAEQDNVDAFIYTLTQMREGGILAIPDTLPDIQLHEIDPNSTDIFISALGFFNREISKVLSLQTLATEIGNVGSNAAAMTHHDRETIPQQEIRLMVEDAFNRQFIPSILNVNPSFKSKDGNDCYFEFFEEDNARESWAKTLEIAAKYVYVPAEVWGKKLQIEVKEYESSNEPVESKPIESKEEGFSFAANIAKVEDKFETDIDDSIRVQVEQITNLINDSTSYSEMLDKVNTFSYSKETEKVIRESSSLAWLAGILDATNDVSA